MGVIAAATTFVRGLLGLGATAVRTGTALTRTGAGISRGAQQLVRVGGPAIRRIAPFAAAGAGGAIVGGTLLDDVNPDLAAQLRQMGFDPARLSPRPKLPELVFDPASGATFRRVKKRRRRGITFTELRGFERVTDLLASVGRVPAPGRKKTRRKSRRR